MTARRGGGDGAGLDPRITRRDFVNSTLVGAGAALLGAPAPAAAQAAGAAWTGYGGVGEYASSNGDTWATMESAHRIRDGLYDGALKEVVDTGETYDLVVVGGGFAGLGALYEFHASDPRGAALLLDNQEVFGGYAKSNDFDVDGHRVSGGQASLNFIAPQDGAAAADDYWAELGLPGRFRFAEREGGDPAIKVQRGTSSNLYHGEQCATAGYFFPKAGPGGAGAWVKDMWKDDLKRAPLPPEDRAGLLALRDRRLRGPPQGAEAVRLDGITFADFAARELGAGEAAQQYVTLGMCITGPKISALAAKSLPGLDRYAPGSPQAELGERFVSFPGGNATLARYFVKAIWPDALAGPATLPAIASGALDRAALDRPGAPCRMRLRATVVRVRHEGDPRTADHVEVVYERGGRLYRVRARSVVLGIGAWVAKHVVADLPAERRAALDAFLYAPMLMVNVALRNWRFLDRLGVSTARWFDGFGFYGGIRQPMVLDPARPPPFHPDKPIVMTLYVPFPNPKLPLEASGSAGRFELYSGSYADFEARVVAQMTAMFGAAGFDARRDVAGIVLNRWGHAFISPGLGFFYGRDGAPSPQAVAAEPFGRIVFAQSGAGDWMSVAHGGRAATRQAVSRL